MNFVDKIQGSVTLGTDDELNNLINNKNVTTFEFKEYNQLR